MFGGARLAQRALLPATLPCEILNRTLFLHAPILLDPALAGVWLGTAMLGRIPVEPLRVADRVLLLGIGALLAARGDGGRDRQPEPPRGIRVEGVAASRE